MNLGCSSVNEPIGAASGQELGEQGAAMGRKLVRGSRRAVGLISVGVPPDLEEVRLIAEGWTSGAVRDSNSQVAQDMKKARRAACRFAFQN